MKDKIKLQDSKAVSNRSLSKNREMNKEEVLTQRKWNKNVLEECMKEHKVKDCHDCVHSPHKKKVNKCIFLRIEHSTESLVIKDERAKAEKEIEELRESRDMHFKLYNESREREEKLEQQNKAMIENLKKKAFCSKCLKNATKKCFKSHVKTCDVYVRWDFIEKLKEESG